MTRKKRAATVPSSDMTTANKITIFRILLVPFFVVQFLYYVRTGRELYWLLAMLAFALAALSDGLDGYIARRYNQKSELGAILDPLADKLLLFSAIILLSFYSGDYFARIPLWLTGIIISRDLMVLIGVAVVHIMCGKVVVQTRLLGKLATVFQMGTVLWILFKWTDRALPFWIFSAAFFTAISGMICVFDGIRQLSASPTSAATKDQ
ncbi:MAG: CDP-diacylglycerol--glycerol-3-phosphate 3-phosphatidyltransferase [Verrucomicrobiota bacterium]